METFYKKKYIMSLETFTLCCNVSGFNNINGNTYQDHILLIAKDRIPKYLHEEIKPLWGAVPKHNLLSFIRKIDDT